MKNTLRRAAATAMLTLAVAVPLTTTAQAAEVPTQKAAASHPCHPHDGCWGDWHHDHHLLDLDLGLL
ncbi:hypothetical protein [Streptomyces sp. MZ04]|uniref:hypothetical protein n=1 Tax=Streptomyces sp. MZ04 TaxID=2559236 RepID=UPI00107ED568|nr:hypothetical protein [Streptomyces sp. MZ04]TGA93794.1 hypothetical protein E2651_35470 [Streptomyces sp. MZ04]